MEVSGAHEIVKDAFKIFSTNETAQLMEDVEGDKFYVFAVI